MDKVSALTQHAAKLEMKAHYQRCLEKFSAAREAALALGAEDCLVVATLTAEVATTTVTLLSGYGYAREPVAFVLEVRLETPQQRRL